MTELVDAALASRAWPFVEARRLVQKYSQSPPAKGYVLFQTGYGPSGLPHIGTFGEVVRTTMVRNAFAVLSKIPTRLICFSDDLDGFRRVPDNVPNRDALEADLGLPLTKVRDPFGTHASFAAHNNAKLCEFLSGFAIDYEFVSATDMYISGRFDAMLLRALREYDRIMEIVLPTLGGVATDRPETYSPFLPISKVSGQVLQVPIIEHDPARGTITYQEADGTVVDCPVTGGNVKMQWKTDWAMRWAALGVDYEMYGKDLIPSADLAKQLCRVFGAAPPVDMFYELFLDEHGRKISKSRGTESFSMETWLHYADPESLSLFMYQKPGTAKRLHFDIVPRTVDDYHRHLDAFSAQDLTVRLNNPVWHIHNGTPPKSGMTVPYSMLLNLVSAAGEASDDVIWGMIDRYQPDRAGLRSPDLVSAVQGARRYYRDRIVPTRRFRPPTPVERAALEELVDRLRDPVCPREADSLQRLVYAIGRQHCFDPMRDWFRCIYEVVFGTEQGPRFGSFIALFGPVATADLVASKLHSDLVGKSA